MMNLANRVVARYVLADAIGDPEDLAEWLKIGVAKFAEKEQTNEKLLAHLKLIIDAHGPGPDPRDPGLFFQLLGPWNTTMYGDVASIFVLTDRIFRILAPHGRMLFLAILQQLALSPALTKKVQAAARFWSKSDLRFLRPKDRWMPRNAEYVTGYEKLLKELRQQVAVAYEAIQKGKAHAAEGATTKLNAGPFKVVNTGGFSDAAMEEAAKAVTKAAQLLAGIGLSRICYGDVLVSNTLTSRSNVLAFYLIAKDEMFVRANVKADTDVVRTICHELAHRLEHKFLQAKDREITGIYRTLNTKDMMGLSDLEFPPRGKVVEYQGRPLTVVDVDFRRRAVKFKDPADPPNMVSVAPLQLWLQRYEGQEPHQQKGISFVTPYAKKSPSENLAEMVSYWAIGKLPAEQVEMLKALLS